MPSSEPAASRPVEKWADNGDLRMRYLDWGGDGPPIIALHGLASSAHWYDLVCPYLRSQYRIVSPDQRGHGQTTQAPSGYDWSTLASDVVGLMDHLEIERAAVLGHSWGGNVATGLAAKFPKRVSALVMIDGGFFDGRLRRDATWENFSTRLSPREVSGTRHEFLERLRIQLAECWSDELERIVQTMVYEDEEGQIKDILLPENHAQVIRAMWDEPASVVLPKIECGTMIVPAEPRPERANSEFAVMRREMVEAASRAIKDCRVHWIQNTSHDIGYYQPEELGRVTHEFLQEVLSQG